jgi:hypothetical protein
MVFKNENRKFFNEPIVYLHYEFMVAYPLVTSPCVDLIIVFMKKILLVFVTI